MQFFNFIFLERSWAADRLNLTSRLSAIAAHHMTTTTETAEEDEPLALIIYPEGTCFSKISLTFSTKYAEKMGVVCTTSSSFRPYADAFPLETPTACATPSLNRSPHHPSLAVPTPFSPLDGRHGWLSWYSLGRLWPILLYS